MLVHRAGSLNDSDCVAVKFYIKHVPIYKTKGGLLVFGLVFFFGPATRYRKNSLLLEFQAVFFCSLASLNRGFSIGRD